MTATPSDLARAAGLTWMPQQEAAFLDIQAQAAPQRLCLYFRTGGGKTITSLACVALAGCQEALVVAPPVTHGGWHEQAKLLGLKIQTISHAKFRMPSFKVRRDVALIADEFHMFGGHDGKGWKKLDRAAKGIKAPVILASATPNYNDAERCYCIKHILNPAECKGGYLQFLYTECYTEADPFSMTPKVIGFRDYTDAAQYLASLDHVIFLPDDAVYYIEDVNISLPLSRLEYKYNYYSAEERIAASLMELRHLKKRKALLNDLDQTFLGRDARDALESSLKERMEFGKILIFCASSRVACAAYNTLMEHGMSSARLLIGNTSTHKKQAAISEFITSDAEVLIGTATLATGTDGLDKVCNTLILLDDTDDDALRRQVIGRIMPRGKDKDANNKAVIRFNIVSD